MCADEVVVVDAAEDIGAVVVDLVEAAVVTENIEAVVAVGA